VKAAVEAGKEAASRVGNLVASHVIARPSSELLNFSPPNPNHPRKETTTMAGQALGMIETKGLTAQFEATDAMFEGRKRRTDRLGEDRLR